MTLSLDGFLLGLGDADELLLESTRAICHGLPFGRLLYGYDYGSK